MKYITGIHALNLPCNLETCGNWHQSAIQWDKPNIAESQFSLWGDYGIELNHKIPEHKNETFAVANTIRACLDLLYNKNFPTVQGMNDDFICNEKYDQEVFNLVYKMRHLSYWEDINNFMNKEYKLKWINYIKKQESV